MNDLPPDSLHLAAFVSILIMTSAGSPAVPAPPASSNYDLQVPLRRVLALCRS